MEAFFSVSAMVALFKVIMIDLLLAVDNAIIVGLVASTVAPEYRNRVIFIGVLFATIMRVGFAVITSYLLMIPGLLVIGGGLLLWVSWKMVRDVRHKAEGREKSSVTKKPAPKTLTQAVYQVVFADVAMSLDNVLAVAGAAREHIEILIFGLALSIFLMGVASGFLAKLMQKYKWLVYIGIGVLLLVAVEMTASGVMELLEFIEQ